MKGLISSLLIFLLVGCSHRLVVPDNAKVMGHGGMGIKSLLPLDSYPSLLKAYNILDGTEGDVQMTKDCVLVYWHNSSLPKKKGIISSVVYDSLPKNRYIFKKYEIISVDSFLSSIDSGKIVSLDIKIYGLDDAGKKIFAKKLKSIAKKYSGKNIVFFETGDDLILEKLSNDHYNYTLFYYAGSGTDVLNKCDKANIDGISMHFKFADASMVKKIKDKGCKVMLWGMHNVRDLKKAFEAGADYYQTDKIKFKRK